ncbi:MAG: DUF882 domain-containing protein [Pseudomonadota bacterium]
MQNTPQYSTTRRAALACALATSLMPCAHAIAGVTKFPELKLKLYNLHTTESIDAVFWANGQYNIDALADLNRLLRDHRTNEIKPIDPRLFSLLYLLNKKISNHRAVSVISGYRSPATNQMLAERNAGVATNSYHVKGRAIDIRIPGKDTKKLRDIGIKLGVGGVGYYERSNFAHFDTGPRRSW